MKTSTVGKTSAAIPKMAKLIKSTASKFDIRDPYLPRNPQLAANATYHQRLAVKESRASIPNNINSNLKNNRTSTRVTLPA